MMRVVAGISCFFTVLVAYVTAQSTTGTCTAADQLAYVSQQLPASCGINLGIVNSNTTADAQSVLDGALDVACSENCGGELSNWLLNQCNDSAGAAGLFYWCLNTDGTAGNNSRCRYATPPYFDAMASLGGAVPCFVANATDHPCPSGCAMALMGLAELGCCYQSLYNNTDYLQGILNAGSLTQPQFQALRGLSNPLLWAACQVTPPAMECTNQGIDFPMQSISTATVFHPFIMIILLVIVLYTLF